MADLPLILAGPILRRCEPGAVSVWLALREACDATFNIYSGIVSHSSLPDKAASGAAKSIQIGERLHFVVATATPPSAAFLSPERLYSYNIVLAPTAGGASKDLQSLGLLQNRSETNGRKAHLCLGYQEGMLPSFALPPRKITDLHLLQGSCRRLNNFLEDGLSWADDLIQANRSDALKRPHQMYLTGDQIYADDVSLPLLPQMQKCGQELLGNKMEELPTLWPFPAPANSDNNAENKIHTHENYWPADRTHFPPGIRDRLIDTEASFTTSDKHSHLLSFGEFTAMYLYSWSNELWDLKALENFDQIIAGISKLPANWGAIFRETHPDHEPIKDELLEKFASFLVIQLDKQKLRHAFKGGDRSIADESDIKALDSDRLRRADDGTFAKWSDSEKKHHKDIFAFATRLSAEEIPEFRRFFKTLKTDFSGRFRKYSSERGVDGRFRNVAICYKTLPKVRRALANIPTYMMFDDHEVTDDWNLNPMWRDRVYTSPLGRTILRNGLLAYALFQGWGNDPAKFVKKKLGESNAAKSSAVLFRLPDSAGKALDESKLSKEIKNLFVLHQFQLSDKAAISKKAKGWLLTDSKSHYEFVIEEKRVKVDGKEKRNFHVFGNLPQANLLDKLQNLFTKNGLSRPVAQDIDVLLGLDGKDPPVRWHFSVPGEQHHAISLDNRTRRSFVTRIGPPGNVAIKAMPEQIPPPDPAKDIKALVVLAPLPVFAPPVFDEAVAPTVYRVFDVVGYHKGKRAVRSGMAGTNPDAIEAWSFDSKTFEALLQRLEPYRRVVFLSGDVHFGSSQAMSYWRDVLAIVELKTVTGLDQQKIPEAIRQGLISANVPLAPDASIEVETAGDAWRIQNKSETLLLKKSGNKIIISRVDNQPARFAQFTSSGLRNVTPSWLRNIADRFARAQAIFQSKIGSERLGWFKTEPAVIQFSDVNYTPASYRSRARQSPVMLPTHAWPDDTVLLRPPDWTWRVQVVRDTRPDADRPEPAQPDPVSIPFDAADPIDGYRKVVARHARHLEKRMHSRQVLGANNLGLVRFEERDDVLIAIHEMYAVFPTYPDIALTENYTVQDVLQAYIPQKPEIYCRHEVPLAAPDEAKPELGGTS